MAKIIKVGSQNPTFTSAKTKKASSIQTHRNSNEATNPFKFTNFEGNTLQFADVFEGFKPQSTSKLRMIASSVAGSMSKMKSSIAEPIVAFVNRVKAGVSHAWDYAKNTNISDIPGIKQTKDFLLAERHLPEIYNLSSHVTALKESVRHTKDFLLAERHLPEIKGLTTGINAIKEGISNISFSSRQRYANMSVAELRECLAVALAEGGINE